MLILPKTTQARLSDLQATPYIIQQFCSKKRYVRTNVREKETQSRYIRNALKNWHSLAAVERVLEHRRVFRY